MTVLVPGTAAAQWSQVGQDLDGEVAGVFAGWSVALSADGSRLAVGEPSGASGQVRVYRWQGTAWVQVGSDIDGETSGDASGWSVALSADGSRVAVGAVANSANAGHVRVYQYQGIPIHDWLQVGQDIDGEAADDWSGYAVSMSSDGNRVAIGAPYNHNPNGDNAGQVRVYAWSSPSWVQRGQDIDGAAADDLAGRSVALSADGSRVAVGSIGHAGETGQVRVYEWFQFTSTWILLDPAIEGDLPGDRAGYSVALSDDGSRVAVGATGSDRETGLVRVYDRDDGAGSWNQVGQDLTGEAQYDHSGFAVALSGDGETVAVGAPDNNGSGALAGHVRVYGRRGAGWVQLGRDIDGEAAGDSSGRSAALSVDGLRVAIGAPENDGNGAASGQVRVYEGPVFSDGFESGDTTAWSSSSP